MSKTINNYMTADTEGDFVVLLTGMRINKLWKFWKWLPVFVTMPRMNQELMKHSPDTNARPPQAPQPIQAPSPVIAAFIALIIAHTNSLIAPATGR
jgi:hypothetical protein